MTRRNGIPHSLWMIEQRALLEDIRLADGDGFAAEVEADEPRPLTLDDVMNDLLDVLS